jgi:lipopolysaccharide transport system ATP-binding protein
VEAVSDDMTTEQSLPEEVHGYHVENGSCDPYAHLPTIFHITHWKAGSQWIHRMFHYWFYDRLVLPRPDQGQFFSDPIRAGRVYPTVYVTKREFESIQVPDDHLRFLIIRDLRDTLVSFVFSLMYSHRPEESLGSNVLDFRQRFEARRVEDMMLYVIRTRLKNAGAIQMSWVEAGEPILRYEELLENDLELLTELFSSRVPLHVSPEQLHEVILANRFEQITGGRQRGEENILAHERKGIVGDWRNYFTPRIARLFKCYFGEYLIATGYEKDFSW